MKMAMTKVFVQGKTRARIDARRDRSVRLVGGFYLDRRPRDVDYFITGETRLSRARGYTGLTDKILSQEANITHSGLSKDAGRFR